MKLSAALFLGLLASAQAGPLSSPKQPVQEWFMDKHQDSLPDREPQVPGLVKFLMIQMHELEKRVNMLELENMHLGYYLGDQLPEEKH